MSIVVKEVLDKKALKTFVKLPFAMYKNDPMWVPQLISDDMEIFNKEKNPAYENADSRLFLAYKDGKPVGRIAAIDSRVANKKYDTKNLRFGWFDATDDPEVAAALFQPVEAWARELGLETVTGPHGFCDLDPQGMLVEGFDQLPTIAGYYNFPYYQKLVEDLGFAKEIDYVEFRTQVPADMSAFPEKLLRLADRILERGGFRLLKYSKKKDILGRGQGAVPPDRRGVRGDLRRRAPDREAGQLLHQEIFLLRGQGFSADGGQREGRDGRLHARHAQPLQGVPEGQRPPFPPGLVAHPARPEEERRPRLLPGRHHEEIPRPGRSTC